MLGDCSGQSLLNIEAREKTLWRSPPQKFNNNQMQAINADTGA